MHCGPLHWLSIGSSLPIWIGPDAPIGGSDTARLKAGGEVSASPLANPGGDVHNLALGCTGRQKSIWTGPALFALKSRVHAIKQLENTALCSQPRPARRFTRCLNMGQNHPRGHRAALCSGFRIPREVEQPWQSRGRRRRWQRAGALRESSV